MGIITGNEQEKSQLIKEICDISSRAAACVHLHLSNTSRPPFIDWYLILKVKENAELDAIRKQYHKLALKLHPDKNNHSNAETAFKLVSEGYFCLSDNARRAAFDSERKTSSCNECNTINNNNNNHPNVVKVKNPHQETASRFSRIRRRIKELRTKLEEEAKTIDKCLISNAATSRSEPVNKTELPVFNPSDYKHKGYPRHRTINQENLMRADFILGSKCMRSFGKKDSPIFEYRSERVPFMSRSASTRGQ